MAAGVGGWRHWGGGGSQWGGEGLLAQCCGELGWDWGVVLSSLLLTLPQATAGGGMASIAHLGVPFLGSGATFLSTGHLGPEEKATLGEPLRARTCTGWVGGAYPAQGLRGSGPAGARAELRA